MKEFHKKIFFKYSWKIIFALNFVSRNAYTEGILVPKIGTTVYSAVFGGYFGSVIRKMEKSKLKFMSDIFALPSATVVAKVWWKSYQIYWSTTYHKSENEHKS